MSINLPRLHLLHAPLLPMASGEAGPGAVSLVVMKTRLAPATVTEETALASTRAKDRPPSRNNHADINAVKWMVNGRAGRTQENAARLAVEATGTVNVNAEARPVVVHAGVTPGRESAATEDAALRMDISLSGAAGVVVLRHVAVEPGSGQGGARAESVEAKAASDT